MGGIPAQRAFRLLFAAEAISSLGDRLVIVALAFAVLNLTGSATDLGVVLAAQTIPLVVFVLLGGVWADRLPRRLVMASSDLIRAASQGLSAVLLLTGSAHLWEIVVLQAVYGTARAFFDPAALSVVPQTVDAAQLQRANGLIALTGNVAGIAGPALAGVIVAAASPGWGLAFDAVTFLASVAFVLAMPPITVEVRERTTLVHELRHGWSAFRARRWLWITVGCFTLYMGFAWAPWQVLGPDVARTSLGGPGAWAAIAVALGVGSVAGGLISLRARPRHPFRLTFAIFVVITPALFGLVAAHASLWLIVPVALIDGSSGTIFNTFWFTAVQSDVPAGELARVMSWDYFGSVAILPLGQALAGPVAAAIGSSTALYGAAALTTVLFGLALCVPAVRNFSPPAVTPPPAGPIVLSGGG
ncbi:MAG TPA: MFS transporter [Solirubrobacteraceae bacterium]|nr:MFS transporter [Solirubrobacteraceae bacterium]